MRTLSFSLEKPKYSAWREARMDWAKLIVSSCLMVLNRIMSVTGYEHTLSLRKTLKKSSATSTSFIAPLTLRPTITTPLI